MLAVSIGDDFDVFFRLQDGEAGDGHASAGESKVEPSGADIERDVGGGVGAASERGEFLLALGGGGAPGVTAIGDGPIDEEGRSADALWVLVVAAELE